MEMLDMVVRSLLARRITFSSEVVTLLDNYALGQGSSGGAICAENTVAMNIKDSFFDNNYPTGWFSGGGGAICVRFGSITIVLVIST